MATADYLYITRLGNKHACWVGAEGSSLVVPSRRNGLLQARKTSGQPGLLPHLHFASQKGHPCRLQQDRPPGNDGPFLEQDLGAYTKATDSYFRHPHQLQSKHLLALAILQH